MNPINSNTVSHIEMDECSICLDDEEKSTEIKVQTVCKHAFHDSCLMQWLKANNNCPMCRTVIVKNDQPQNVPEPNPLPPMPLQNAQQENVHRVAEGPMRHFADQPRWQI